MNRYGDRAVTLNCAPAAGDVLCIPYGVLTAVVAPLYRTHTTFCASEG